MGVGIHGEPGRRRMKLGSADAIADEMTAAIMGDLGSPQGREALLLVNGFGGTPLVELYLIYNAARRLLENAACEIVRSLVGNSSPPSKWRGARSPLASSIPRRPRCGTVRSIQRRSDGEGVSQGVSVRDPTSTDGKRTERTMVSPTASQEWTTSGPKAT